MTQFTPYPPIYVVLITSMLLFTAFRALHFDLNPDSDPLKIIEADSTLTNISEFIEDDVISEYNQFKLLALKEEKRVGIPWEVTMSQWRLESASGTSYLAVNANNFFGVKCFKKNCPEGHCIQRFDSMEKSNDRYKVYPSMEVSFYAHSEFLLKERYAKLRDCKSFECWAKGLSKYGYATDPAYSTKLINQKNSL